MLFYNKRIFERCFRFTGLGWFKYIPLYFKQMHHLIKHGYDIGATWDTFSWFIDTMRPILTEYRKTHIGYPIIDSNISNNIQSLSTGEEKTSQEEEWDAIIDRMIELLDLMDEGNPKYDAPEYEEDLWRADKERYAAKDEFFQLFAKYFYHLWD